MKTLKQLCEISAVSGFEKRALNDFSEVFSSYGFTSVKTDEYGNIYGEKNKSVFFNFLYNKSDFINMSIN